MKTLPWESEQEQHYATLYYVCCGLSVPEIVNEMNMDDICVFKRTKTLFGQWSLMFLNY